MYKKNFFNCQFTRKIPNFVNILDYYHPTLTKRAVVKSLADRAKNLCSIEVVESEK